MVMLVIILLLKWMTGVGTVKIYHLFKFCHIMTECSEPQLASVTMLGSNLSHGKHAYVNASWSWCVHHDQDVCMQAYILGKAFSIVD